MASGDTLSKWQSMAATFPTSAFAPLVRRNNHFLLGFDAATTESVFFQDTMGRAYDGGGITIQLTWAADTAVVGVSVWSASLERHQDDTDDLDTPSFASPNSVQSSASSAAGELQYVEIAFTDGAEMDSIAAGEDFRLNVARNGVTGSDSMAGDAQLKSVEIRET